MSKKIDFLRSIKENENLMKRYGFDKNNFIHYKNQTDTFDKIEKMKILIDEIFIFIINI